VLRSLEKIAKEEASKKRPNDVIFDSKDNDHLPVNVNLLAQPTPLLKLKIRNTTKYLNWRLSILKITSRVRFVMLVLRRIKALRLEVHHAKTYDGICKENNVSTVEQALGCEELWSMTNGVSIRYRCHKDVERLRTKLRNMFLIRNLYWHNLHC
jgi:hypothetical protein